MAKQNLSIEVEGNEKLQLAFRGIVGTIEDFTPIFAAVESWFFEVETDMFQSGGATNKSGKWKELSSAYEEVKVKRFGTAALLQGANVATERTKKSLTRKTADTVIQKSKDEMAIGTSVPYAKHIQKARPIIDPSDSQIKDLRKRIKKSLLPYLRRSTLIVTEDTEDIG